MWGEILFNLITDKWIPVIRESGKRDVIAPWQIVDDNDPPLDLDFVRPDFDVSVTMFLIALLETVLPPKDEDHWLDILESPPSEEGLRSLMLDESSHFELFGDGERFMQFRSSKKTDKIPISKLLITSVTDKGEKDNTDFFIKRDKEPRSMCTTCASAALITKQYMAKAGGSGHKASAMRGSPLVSLALGNNLWETVYLNVPTEHQMKKTGGSSNDASPYPWSLDHNIHEIIPNDSHPTTILWSSVNNISLEEPSRDKCNLCGKTDMCVHSLSMPADDYSYDGWRHPLNPNIKRNEEYKPFPASIEVRHLDNWAALVFEGQDVRIPALNISQILNNIEEITKILRKRCEIRLCGYMNDNMKTIAWIDTTVPTYMGRRDRYEEFYLLISKLVEIASKTNKALEYAVKDAYKLINEKGKAKREIKNPVTKTVACSELFWNRCDNKFRAIIEKVEQHPSDAIESEWSKVTKDIAIRIFDDTTKTVPIEEQGDIVKIRQKLIMKTSSFRKGGSDEGPK